MGLYQIECPHCLKGYTWFSGNLGQLCPACKKWADESANTKSDIPKSVSQKDLDRLAALHSQTMANIEPLEPTAEENLIGALKGTIATQEVLIEFLKAEVARLKAPQTVTIGSGPIPYVPNVPASERLYGPPYNPTSPQPTWTVTSYPNLGTGPFTDGSTHPDTKCAAGPCHNEICRMQWHADGMDELREIAGHRHPIPTASGA